MIKIVLNILLVLSILNALFWVGLNIYVFFKKKTYKTDPYLCKTRSYQRLRKTYRDNGRIIIACDFDDTVNDYHKKGWKYEKMIQLLQRWSKHSYIIIWTSRPEKMYPEVEDYLVKNKIPYNAINSPVPWYKDECRKIYANIYLDDKAGLNQTYNELKRLIKEIEAGKIIPLQKNGSLLDMCNTEEK